MLDDGFTPPPFCWQTSFFWRPVLGAPWYRVNAEGQFEWLVPGSPETWIEQHTVCFTDYLMMKIDGRGDLPGRGRVHAHTLVAEAFHGRRPKGYVINHKNAIKTDNRAENLEYCTNWENSCHGVAMYAFRRLLPGVEISLSAVGLRSWRDALDQLSAMYAQMVA